LQDESRTGPFTVFTPLTIASESKQASERQVGSSILLVPSPAGVGNADMAARGLPGAAGHDCAAVARPGP